LWEIEERGKVTIYCANGTCEAPLNEGVSGASAIEAFVRLCKRFDDWEEGK
jgi:hypothetical protein